MRSLRPFVWLGVLLICPVFSFAQTPKQIDHEVYQKLRLLEPKNTKMTKYSIVLPTERVKLPEAFQLDIVYKVGHYEWEIGALRFESNTASDSIAVTRLATRSAFSFYREMSPGQDEFEVQLGTMAKRDLVRLLSTALLYFDANIQVQPPDMIACGSSGDGSVLFKLGDAGKGPNTGSWRRQGAGQIVGDLIGRTKCGYNEVRITLFWQVVADYLTKIVVFSDVEPSRIEDLLISRLVDDPIVENYRDSFRQSLTVDLLGEFGTAKAISPLEQALTRSRLDDRWQKHLIRDTENSIRRIRSRASAQP